MDDIRRFFSREPKSNTRKPTSDAKQLVDLTGSVESTQNGGRGIPIKFSWACPRCTYVNQPGNPKCVICRTLRHKETTNLRDSSLPPSTDPPKSPPLHPLLRSRSNKETALFSDPEFQPCPSSLDGRCPKKGEKSEIKAGEKRRRGSVTCGCGRAARVRTVGREGVNQGRKFWSCSTRDSAKRCNFFQWADNDPHNETTLRLRWCRFRPPRFRLVRRDSQGLPVFRASDILQGSVGDCWFLSAVSVVAERRPDLIKNIFFPGEKSGKGEGGDQGARGCYGLRMFLDGDWREILVDDYLPVRNREKGGSKRKKTGVSSSSKTRPSSPKPIPTVKDLENWSLAYSKSSQTQIWAPILEKAYAKWHGSYAAISGGWVHEGLLDLTGCPVESIEFSDPKFDSESTWARLLSFHNSAFPMGAGTGSGRAHGLRETGLVGCHAYSILEVREINRSSGIGKQLSIDTCFKDSKKTSEILRNSPKLSTISGNSKRPPGTPGESRTPGVSEDLKLPSGIESRRFEGIPGGTGESLRFTDTFGDSDEMLALALQREEIEAAKHARERGGSVGNSTSGPIRLLRIRNPWGRREWNGSFSRKSDVWTAKLRKQLDTTSANDGTFWMTYTDFMSRFAEVDVCKAHRGWVARGFHEIARAHGSVSRNHLADSGEYDYHVTTNETTWCFIMLIQPTKRGRGRKAIYYSDVGICVQSTSQTGVRRCEDVRLSGAVRNTQIEILFRANVKYTITPLIFNMRVGRHEPEESKFVLRFFSAKPLQIQRTPILPLSLSEALKCIACSPAVIPSIDFKTKSCKSGSVTLASGSSVALLIASWTPDDSKSRLPLSSTQRQNNLIAKFRLQNMKLVRRVPYASLVLASHTPTWRCDKCTLINYPPPLTQSSNPNPPLSTKPLSKSLCNACGSPRPEPLVKVTISLPVANSTFISRPREGLYPRVVGVFASTCSWNCRTELVSVESG
ncbi:hypothetical protein AAMO2058_000982500 [Amorphochlora amoebiformis]